MSDYYGELCTRMYERDKSLAQGEELRFFLSFVENKEMNVLEPMCGNGRMLIPFMQEGIDIEGFDLSVDMLERCREKCVDLNLIPTIYHDKIEEFSTDKKYDLIMIPFGSFSLLTDHLVAKSLENLSSLLKENGKLLLTIMTTSNTSEEIPNWAQTNRVEFTDDTIIEWKKVHYDEHENTLHTTIKYVLMRDQTVIKTETMNFPVRLYEENEFDTILSRNGFPNVTIHEVKDGYGFGRSFDVYECMTEKAL
ncbi:class I SAM-dependent DNA methyltransferase [Priestia koreensis]|uniref:class I SAM-dependent DNA methyltransferase n=1 Tax=Priestia koreensis TaxID=284581 RepID=UPI001F5A2679|nr:class I SAM-dependent methyltransferase [Priestia koreensis]UNL83263.1 class I SAM-dependent methyltransferase [Priestia koreensis]